MEDLFYSKQEKILFWVAGYTDNSNIVTEMIEKLNQLLEKFNEVAKVDPKEIRTHYIEDSRRYKYMRVLYVETPNIPKDAFVIGENTSNDQGPHTDWTMWQWLKG